MLSTAALVAQPFFLHTVACMEEKKSKRGIVTPENKAESERLLKLWTLHRPSDKSQADFGEDFGIGSQSAVTNMLHGYMAISLKAAKGFAKGLGVEVKQFSPRLARAIDEAATAAWPLGDEISPTVWANLPDKIKTKIRNDAEYIVREHRMESGKLPTSRDGAKRRRHG